MKTPTNKDILKTLAYYLVIFITAFGLVLLILSANWFAETITNWFK